LTFFIAYFSDPQRRSPEGENLVLAPAGGVVISGNAPEKHLGEEMLKISIFMSFNA
jgi:hypothetical protein